jgi:hypothetical protein
VRIVEGIACKTARFGNGVITLLPVARVGGRDNNVVYIDSAKLRPCEFDHSTPRPSPAPSSVRSTPASAATSDLSGARTSTARRPSPSAHAPRSPSHNHLPAGRSRHRSRSGSRPRRSRSRAGSRPRRSRSRSASRTRRPNSHRASRPRRSRSRSATREHRSRSPSSSRHCSSPRAHARSRSPSRSPVRRRLRRGVEPAGESTTPRSPIQVQVLPPINARPFSHALLSAATGLLSASASDAQRRLVCAERPGRSIAAEIGAEVCLRRRGVHPDDAPVQRRGLPRPGV